MGRRGESALGQLENAGQAANGTFSTATSSVGTATNALDTYGRETSEAAAALNSLNGAGNEAEGALDRQAHAAKHAADGIEQFGDESEQAGEQAGRFGTASVDAVQELSKALAAAGIAKALHAIYEGFVTAVTAAIGFESAVTGVYKTVDGSSEQLEQISNEIKTMSTVMPASAVSIASVVEAAGQLGIATNDITSFTEVMINLGEATNLTSNEAASSLAKFTNITGMVAANYESLGSTIVALGNEFATTEADIVAMSTRMASAGTLAGLTEPEILALAASMSSVGIEADAGGSAMSKLLTDMQVAVETGSDRLEEFASVAGMTGNEFAETFGTKASDALYSFIAGLNDTERNGATATVVLENMGITEIRLSNAVKSLANNSDGLSSAIGVANTAWQQNIALATEAGLRYGTLDSRLSMSENSSANLAAALGDDLTPVLGFFVDTGRGLTDWLTGVVEKHPAVTAGLTAVAVAIGVVAAAVTVFSLVTSPIVVGAITAITTAMMANPIFLIITGVVALTAAVVAFVAIMASQQTEYDTWTASTKKQYDELQQLNTEYEVACEQYGETSDEALVLRYQIDELSASFESGKMSVEAFVAECDALVESHDKIVSSYAEASAAMDYEAQGTLALIHKLEQLGQKTDLTAGEQEQMKAIIEKLNETVPDLALNYDDVTSSLDTTVTSLEKMAQAQASQEKHAENYRTYVDLLKEQSVLEEQMAEAEANLNAERERRGMYYDEISKQWTNDAYSEDSPWASWTTDLDDYTGSMAELQTAYDENIALQSELTAEMERFAAETDASKDAYISYGDAVNAAIGSIQSEMDELIGKYDEAYISARQNIDGVIGLFDTMKAETEISVSDMAAALETQSAYLAAYTENLRKASDYGLNEGLIASLSDGSAESAGQLDVIIKKIEELSASSADAASFVSGFNASFAEVQTAKDTFAATVADMQTNFSTKMDEMERKLQDSIANMNMESEAAAAARATMSGYISSIRAQQEAAVSAARAVANATAAALNSTARMPSKKYAVGTASALPGLALVGEEGPELINFGGGEIVYTAPETANMLSDSPDAQFNVPIPEKQGCREMAQQGDTSEKKITLEINGSGKIDVSGANEDTVWGIVEPKLKSAFMGIVRREIFEEGDLAYEF